MQVLHLAVARPITRKALIAATGFALSALILPVSAQTPAPTVKTPPAKAPAEMPAPRPAQKTVDDNGQRPAPTLTQVSAGADEVTHLVKRGDTLWDLAKEYLKDPFRWPDVFQRNTDIVENPHWIYPGETIRIPSSEVRPEVFARIVTKPAPPSDRTVFGNLPPGMVPDRIGSNGEVLGRIPSSGVPRGEIEAAPFADRVNGPRGSGKLAAAYDRPGIASAAGERRFQLKDRVFVNLPRTTAARVGDVLMAYRLGPSIDEVSQVVIPTGLLRIESADPGQMALARVMRQFGEIKLDQAVLALTDLQPSSGSPMLVPPGPAERVVYFSSNPVLPSLQNYVILTAKSANGVRVGDQFTLIDDSVDPRHPAPPVNAAVAEVVRVTPFGVTAIIVDHEQPKLWKGMTARMTARSPN